MNGAPEPKEPKDVWEHWSELQPSDWQSAVSSIADQVYSEGPAWNKYAETLFSHAE
jgi:hypothetical protein